MYTLIFKAKKEWIATPPDSQTVAALVADKGPLFLRTEMYGDRPTLVTGKLHTLPAMLIMYILFQLVTFFMVTWVNDIKTGKIRRIVMSPTTMADLLAGNILSRVIWILLQVIVILGAGSLILGVRLEIPWFYFSILLLAYMTTAISFGMFVGTFFKTPEKANGIGVITGLLFAALGGCWWPLEMVSDTMRSIAMVLPTGLMMDAISEFIAIGQTAPFPVLNFVGLLLMTATFTPLALKRMRKQIAN